MTVTGRHADSPIRLTLACELGSDLDGGWWPYSPSVARELPELIEALAARLGPIIDIAVNWSSLEGVPDLNSLDTRGSAAIPGRDTRQQRVMTLTGSQARANLLVVPCRTNTALAVMLLRRAADLPILSPHLDTRAFRTADAVVRAARAQRATSAVPANSSS